MQSLYSSECSLKVATYPIDSLCKIELVCTQAMIINLIGRNNYKDMGDGVSDLFSGPATISYLKYLSIVAEELSGLSNIK